MADKSKKDDAQAQFQKLQRAEDGKKAMSEYEAEGIAIRAKTERLRALRLARDAAEAVAAPQEEDPRQKEAIHAQEQGVRPRACQAFWKIKTAAAGAAEASLANCANGRHLLETLTVLVTRRQRVVGPLVAHRRGRSGRRRTARKYHDAGTDLHAGVEV